MKVENFVVAQTGVGRPDYTPAVVTSKATVEVGNQKKWALLVSRRAANVPPDPLAGLTTATIVIPAAVNGNVNGWQLNMGGGVISCNASGIQKVVMCHTPGIVGDFLYDMRGDIIFGPLSSTVISPDEDLTIYLYNLDSVARDFSISLVGVLEKVA